MATIKRIGKDSLGVPIWEVRYYRSSGDKQVNRHLHAASRKEVERLVLLDSQRSAVGLKWSEGLELYLNAKLAEGRSQVALGHVERAVALFVNLMGDLAIEETTPAVFKDFMQQAAKQPVKHRFSGKAFRVSGPKVSNHHRKELLTVARYLRNHTRKIESIPFEHVPALPVKVTPRSRFPVKGLLPTSTPSPRMCGGRCSWCHITGCARRRCAICH